MTCSLNLPQSRLSSPKAAPTKTWRHHSPPLVRVTANTTLTSTPPAELPAPDQVPSHQDASGASSAGICLLPVLPAEYHLREDGFNSRSYRIKSNPYHTSNSHTMWLLEINHCCWGCQHYHSYHRRTSQCYISRGCELSATLYDGSSSLVRCSGALVSPNIENPSCCHSRTG